MNRINIKKHVNIESNIANRCLESCKKLLAGIEETKSGIAAEFRELVASNQKSFQLALNEAEALAWQTDYPQLFFPALAVEKIRAAAAWQTRQQTLQRPRLAFAQAV